MALKIATKPKGNAKMKFALSLVHTCRKNRGWLLLDSTPLPTLLQKQSNTMLTSAKIFFKTT